MQTLALGPRDGGMALGLGGNKVVQEILGGRRGACIIWLPMWVLPRLKKTNPKQLQIPVSQRLPVVYEMVQKYTGQVSQRIAA